MARFPCTLENLCATVFYHSCLPSVPSVFIRDCTNMVQCTRDGFCPIVRLQVADLSCSSWPVSLSLVLFSGGKGYNNIYSGIGWFMQNLIQTLASLQLQG